MAPKKDKKEAILEAMLDLVAEHGFHNAPMSLLAKRSSASPGVIYHYFPSKEDLIHALYLRVKTAKREIVLAGYSTDMPIKNAFLHFWTNAYLFYSTHLRETRFLDQYESSPFFRTAFHEHEEAIDPLVLHFADGLLIHAILELYRRSHRLYRAWKFSQEPIPGILDDAATMLLVRWYFVDRSHVVVKDSINRGRQITTTIIQDSNVFHQRSSQIPIYTIIPYSLAQFFRIFSAHRWVYTSSYNCNKSIYILVHKHLSHFRKTTIWWTR